MLSPSISLQLSIHPHDLFRDAVVLEAADKLSGTSDDLLAVGTFDHGAYGIGEGGGVVGGDIEAVGTSGFLEAGACGGDDGEATLDGFDDGYAEPLVA